MKNSIKIANLKLLSLSILAGIATVTTHAQVVVNETSSLSQSLPVTTSGDLLLGITGVQTGTVPSEGGAAGGVGVLTDGLDANPWPIGTPSDNSLYPINNGTIVTFALSSPSTISEIDTFSGWRDGGRYQQNYILSYSTDGGTTYNAYTTVASTTADTGGVPISLQLTLTDSSGQIATGVTDLQFNFENVQNGGVGFAEIAAYAAPVPEPSTWALISGGLSILVGIQRKRLSKA